MTQIKHRRSLQTTFLLAVLGSAAITLGGCGQKNAGSDTVIRIGHVGPLSGGDAHLGKDNENGARLAVEEINAAGGITVSGKAYKLELLAEDDKADPKEGTLAAQKLVDAGVVAVVGHLNSGASIPASRIYAGANVTQVSPASTAVKYTQQGFKTTYRVVANDNQQGAALARYVVDGVHAKTVAVVDDRTAYGQGLADVVTQELQSRGVKIVTREYTDNKASDFSAILTKIRSAHPDMIVYGGMDDTAGPMVKQLHQLGMNLPVLAGDGACTPEFIHLAGEGAKQLSCTRVGEAVEKLPKGADFVQHYQKRFNAEVQNYSPYCYDAVYILADAIRRANSTDRAAILASMPTTHYTGLTGGIDFDDKGDLKSAAISLYHVEDGKLKYLSTSR